MIEDLENEVWKNIDGFEDYQVSSLGRIKSLKFSRERLLNRNKKPYCNICLCKNKSHTYKMIHHIVYETFCNQKISVRECIHHINEDAMDNRFENLEKMNRIDHQIMHKSNMSIKTKEKMSQNHADFSGFRHPMYNKHHTYETKEKISKNRPDLSGENSSRHKLSKEEVIHIKKLIKEGFDNNYIHNIFLQVSYTTIYDIRNNRSWKSVAL